MNTDYNKVHAIAHSLLISLLFLANVNTTAKYQYLSHTTIFSSSNNFLSLFITSHLFALYNK